MKDYSKLSSHNDSIMIVVMDAYDKGYEDGKKSSCDCKDNMEAEYNRGLNDAWEAAKWLYYNEVNPAEDIFNCEYWEIYSKHTVQEVVHKIKEYEEQQKQDAEIKVGDEVVLNGNASYENEKAIILAYDGKSYPYNVLMSNGDTEWVKEDSIEYKTGRHFDAIAEVLAEMRGKI